MKWSRIKLKNKSGIYILTPIGVQNEERVYIGQSIDINKRFLTHKRNLQRGTGLNKSMRSIFDVSPGHMHWECRVLEFTSNDCDLGVREYYWWNYYGGDAGTLNDNILYSDGRQQMSLESIHQSAKHKHKRVASYNPYTLALVKSYESVKSAAKDVGTNSSKISAAALKTDGDETTVGGLLWRHVDKDDIILGRPLQSVPLQIAVRQEIAVKCTDLLTLDEYAFESITAAKSVVGVSDASISFAIIRTGVSNGFVIERYNYDGALISAPASSWNVYRVWDLLLGTYSIHVTQKDVSKKVGIQPQSVSNGLMNTMHVLLNDSQFYVELLDRRSMPNTVIVDVMWIIATNIFTGDTITYRTAQAAAKCLGVYRKKITRAIHPGRKRGTNVVGEYSLALSKAIILTV